MTRKVASWNSALLESGYLRLEYVISKEGIRVKPDRVQGILDIPVPLSKTAVRRLVKSHNIGDILQITPHSVLNQI